MINYGLMITVVVIVNAYSDRTIASLSSDHDHRVTMGTLLLSRQSWSVHLARGRPGGRFHVWSGGRPTDSSTWHSIAWCTGMLSGNLAFR